jgi:hypothetical protein
MAKFAPYERVLILSDRFADEGAPRGSMGYVIETYGDDAFEVEVSDSRTGESRAQFVATATELEASPEAGPSLQTMVRAAADGRRRSRRSRSRP